MSDKTEHMIKQLECTEFRQIVEWLYTDDNCYFARYGTWPARDLHKIARLILSALSELISLRLKYAQMEKQYKRRYEKAEEALRAVVAENLRLRIGLSKVKPYAEYCDGGGMTLGGKALGDILKKALKGGEE